MSQKDDQNYDQQLSADSEQLIESVKSLTSHIQKSSEDKRNEMFLRHNLRMEDQGYMDSFIAECLEMETWLLYSEALAVCQGWTPSTNQNEHYCVSNWAKAVKKQAEASQFTSLPLLNPQDKPAEWRVKPKALINWLRKKRLEPITEVDTSIDRVIAEQSANKTVTTDAEPNKYTERHAVNREAILHAAVAVLAAFPEQCRKNGKVSASAVVNQIEERSPLWFGHDDPPLGRRAMQDLISKAIKSAS